MTTWPEKTNTARFAEERGRGKDLVQSRDSDGMGQFTVKVTGSKATRHILAERMARLGIREQDLVERFILGSGRGGQKLNKTASCVYLRHVPSGIEVKCQRERSRELNRFLARRELCNRLEQRLLGAQSARQQEIERIRRQKRRRSRRQRLRILEAKHRHSAKKQARRVAAPEEL